MTHGNKGAAMGSTLLRVHPESFRERLICRLIGDTPVIANVTVAPGAVTASRSILIGPGLDFDLGYDREVSRVTRTPDEAADPGRDRDRRTAALFGDDDARRLLAVLSVIAGLAIVAIAAAAVRAS